MLFPALDGIIPDLFQAQRRRQTVVDAAPGLIQIGVGTDGRDPGRASSQTTLPCSSFFSGRKITGWWLMISSAPIFRASCTASGVMSSTTRAVCTPASGSPTSRPLLSQLSWVAKGASEFSFP